MENPRPDKVAVVEEVREKLSSTEAVVFTEYRGLTVADLQELRKSLREVGGEYKVYKNTLVRLATAELDLDLEDTLIGPTALAFVVDRPDGKPGDAVLVAKAIKAFSKVNPLLVVKGGRLGDKMLDEAAVMALADVAPREELLTRLAGGIAAPMTNMARLLQAVPQKMAFALSALIEAGSASDAPADSVESTDTAVQADTAVEPGTASTETETDNNDAAPAEAAGDEATAPSGDSENEQES